MGRAEVDVGARTGQDMTYPTLRNGVITMRDEMDWRKSTFSHANGNCVEAATDDSPNWRKSRSSFANGNCVEAGSADSTVVVRDTADRSGPVLAFPARAWAAFTAQLVNKDSLT